MEKLKRKIKACGTLSDDKMFYEFSSDGILDLVELIKEERKKAVE